MRIIICDDDSHFANKLKHTITSYYKNCGISVEATVTTQPQHLLSRDDLADYSVAFLDADMSPLDGIKLGYLLKKDNSSLLLVYISAYLEFAPQGYTVSAFRYLLKQDLQCTLPLCLDDILKELIPRSAFLSYKQYGETLRIPYRDIYYLQSDLRKINVWGTDSSHPIASFYGKIADYEKVLDSTFLRINKSTLVNMTYISYISRYRVFLKNGFVINTSRKEYAALKQQYIEWRGQF